MRLDKAAHIANILAVIPAYATLWILLRQQPMQQGAPAVPHSTLFAASVSAFLALFTFGVVLSIVALFRKGDSERKADKVNEKADSLSAQSLLVIKQAAYGLGADSYQDVTSSLKRYIVRNHVNVPVSNSTFNCDPFPGKIKRLVVNYSYEAIQGRVVKQEGEQLILPTPRHILLTKVVSLGRDLFAFLRESEPAHSISRVEKIHYGYGRRFKQRAVDLFNELAENHISFDVQPYEIDPPQVAREESIRKIAQECFLVATRMEIEDEMKP